VDKHVRQIVEGLAGDEEAREKAFFSLLDLCKSSYRTSNFPASVRAEALSTYAELKKILFPAQQKEGQAWMFEEDYIDPRAGASLILDILGYFPGADTESELQEALSYDDPRLKFFAATSLLQLGIDVAPRHIFQVAASPEMRNWLYDRLVELGKESLYPIALKTQEAFAESNLVQWLAYPTELGAAPDEIQLMDVVNIGSPERPMDYYVYRFRTFPPHWAADKDWMAGLAGPFSRREAPTTQAQGYTFSTFDPWDSRTLDEHIESTLKLLNEWYERASKKS